MQIRTKTLLACCAGAAAAAYCAYAALAWARYGKKRGHAGQDPLLDRFMPEYDVSERHTIEVAAPAAITFAAASEMDLEDLLLVRLIFRARERLLGATAPRKALPPGLLAKTRALGWGALAEIPKRQIVMGAATQPWLADVVFQSIPPADFVSFHHPQFVKIAWTLRAEPCTESTCLFSTETRVLACGPQARSKFRKYWALLSPGIILIRLVLLGPLKREAERRAASSNDMAGYFQRQH